MIVVLVILALMIVTTALVVAAGMLSSRLSRQEGRTETFPEATPPTMDAPTQTIE